MQVGTGESKLLLFETFWLYYFFFFFTRAIPRGARAPKKHTNGVKWKKAWLDLQNSTETTTKEKYFIWQTQ